MSVVSDQALAAGIASVPTPITDLGSDLFFLHVMIWGDESALTDRTRSLTRGTIESRAMRKVNDDSDIAFVAEKGSQGSGVILQIGGRMLIKTN